MMTVTEAAINGNVTVNATSLNEQLQIQTTP